MEYLEHIILGVIQGLTEFLPVSSSGHLELAKVMLGSDAVPAESTQQTIVLHAATALSTVVVFRKDILRLLAGLFSFKWNDETVFCLKIVLSMIPAAVIGYVFSDRMKELFSGQVLLVGCMLIVTGLLLFLAGRAKKTDKPVGWKDAIIIGIAQMVAILPGISRSGATIATSVLLGNDRAAAARFSFLMVVPLILGKIAKDVLSGDLTATENNLPLAVGFIAAFITGLVACTWMIQLVKKAKLHYFSYYCFIVGAIAIIYATV